MILKEETKILEMKALATSLGHACTPIEKLQRSLGSAIALRMVQRTGKFVWQTGKGSIENFPWEAALQILPARFRGAGSTWSATTMTDIAALFGPLLASSTSYSAGASKGLKTASENVIRVVATAIPAPTLTWTVRNGVDHLMIELQYVLADEDGELNKPKDGNKLEIALTPALEAEIRVQILQDVMDMADAGAPLSPGFLRQLGRLEEADVVEAKLHRMQQLQPPPPPLGTKRKRKASTPTWNVDGILDERPATSSAEATFLVRWEGYHPSWETYRATGNVGEPVTTWEPLSIMLNTEALHAWETTH